MVIVIIYHEYFLASLEDRIAASEEPGEPASCQEVPEGQVLQRVDLFTNDIRRETNVSFSH